jgi:phosphatidylserine/phosphatidylglycerophosphate/cardiolipin synthase-like enzyme
LPAPSSDLSCWPLSIEPDFTDVDLGIARTIPEYGGQAPVREIEALYVDMIVRARRWIYAESQYFASRRIAKAIAARLGEPEGPEIVVIQPETSEGWLQPIAMDTARARLVETLGRLDAHNRLRLYHPFTAAGEPIYVHAKMMIVDDEILRVGSSNFNNRSMRLDTECDVAIVAANDADRTAIAGIRNAMLAEHLGTDCQTIESAIQRSGSLIAAVEELRGRGRSLRPYEIPEVEVAQAWLADNEILDPNGPDEMFEPVAKRTGLIPRPSRASLRNVKSVGSIAAVGAITASVAVAVLALERSRRRRKSD